MIDTDKINNASAIEVAGTALAILDKAQDARPELQVLALGAAFIAFCRRHGADPAEVARASANILASKHREVPAFRAMDLYIKYEL